MRVFREHRPRVKSMISQIIQLDKVLNGSGGGWGGGRRVAFLRGPVVSQVARRSSVLDSTVPKNLFLEVKSGRCPTEEDLEYEGYQVAWLCHLVVQVV